jgi:hypothetical protein
MQSEPTPFRFVYRNHRGEVAERHVIPDAVRFGPTEWHPTPQWLLRAYDLDKQALREFAMSEISSVLANRKEVMPHPDTVQSSGQNTTPPQASEPGVTDELLAELEAPAAIGGTTSEDWWEEYDPLHLDAATEIRRLRALVAEQAARIAALEAGELVRIVRQFRDFARSGAGFSYPPGSLQAIDAALAKLGGPDGKTE